MNGAGHVIDHPIQNHIIVLEFNYSDYTYVCTFQRMAIFKNNVTNILGKLQAIRVMRIVSA